MRRAVFDLLVILLRAGLGLDLQLGSESLPAIPHWLAVIRQADRHHVLPTVALGARRLALRHVEWDSAIGFMHYFVEVELERERRICAQLSEIAEALAAAKIEFVALKGAAFLAENKLEPIGWRFMSDIDLLVYPEQLPVALKIATQLGYSSERVDYNPRDHHHFPMLVAHGKEAGLELHTRVLVNPRIQMLSPELIFDRAVVAHANIRVPSPEERLMHLILHGMLSSRNYAQRRIVLRDLLDYVHLLQTHDIDVAVVRKSFAKAGYAKLIDCFIDLGEQILGFPRGPAGSRHAWVAQAINATLSRKLQQRWLLADWSLQALKMAFTPEGLAMVARSLASPSRLRAQVDQRLHTWSDRRDSEE